jgi:hypothetical protein
VHFAVLSVADNQLSLAPADGRRVKHEAEFFVQTVEEVLRRTPIHFL